MIRLEVKEDVKNVKNYFTSLKLENYVLSALEWSQKNKKINLLNLNTQDNELKQFLKNTLKTQIN